MSEEKTKKPIFVCGRGSAKSTWIPIYYDGDDTALYMNLITGDIVTLDLFRSMRFSEDDKSNGRKN